MSAANTEGERVAALEAAGNEAVEHMIWMLGGWNDRHDEALPLARAGIDKLRAALAASGRDVAHRGQLDGSGQQDERAASGRGEGR